jgi:hypothetical protein
MLTWTVSANFILVFHEVKYEVPEYVTNFEGSSEHNSEGLQMIRAQEQTRRFAYFCFIIVHLLFPSQNEKLSQIFFHLIDFFNVYGTCCSVISKSLEGERRYQQQKKNIAALMFKLLLSHSFL